MEGGKQDKFRESKTIKDKSYSFYVKIEVKKRINYDLLIEDSIYSNFKFLCLFTPTFAISIIVMRTTPTCVYLIFLQIP